MCLFQCGARTGLLQGPEKVALEPSFCDPPIGEAEHVHGRPRHHPPGGFHAQERSALCPLRSKADDYGVALGHDILDGDPHIGEGGKQGGVALFDRAAASPRSAAGNVAYEIVRDQLVEYPQVLLVDVFLVPAADHALVCFHDQGRRRWSARVERSMTGHHC